MSNDKNLEIKKKPQQVTEEDLNKVAGGDDSEKYCSNESQRHIYKMGHC